MSTDLRAFPHPAGDLAAEAWQVLALITAEFVSDPRSVQCFDLRTVERAKAAVTERCRLERRGDVPPLLTSGPSRCEVL